MLEFKKRELKLKLYGEDISVAFPSVAQVEAYQLKIQSSEKSEFDLAQDFLEELGLEKVKTKSMHMEDFQELLKVLLGQKKS
jgi:hypothetical protein